MEQIIFRPEQEKAIVETLASIDKGKTKNFGMPKCVSVRQLVL